MEVETPIAPELSSDVNVGNLFDAAIRDTANPPAVETPQQVETPVEKPEAAPEAKVDTPTKEVQKPAEPAPKKEELSKWKELKEKATKLEEVLPKLTDYEKRVADYEKKVAETEAKYKALEEKEKGYESELTENRTWRMAFDLENTPEYQNAVTRPFMEAQGNLEKLAAQFEIDPAEMWKVATETDEVARARGIFALLRDHEEGPAVKGLLEKQIDKLDKAKDAHAQQIQHAEGLRNQINARQSQQEQEKTLKQQEEYQKARTESWGLLKESLGLPEIFDSKDPSITAALEEIQSAELEDTPMAKAMAARALGIAGLLGKQLREMTTKYQTDIAARDKTIADISGSRPGAPRPVSPVTAKPVDSFDDAWAKSVAGSLR